MLTRYLISLLAAVSLAAAAPHLLHRQLHLHRSLADHIGHFYTCDGDNWTGYCVNNVAPFGQCSEYSALTAPQCS